MSCQRKAKAKWTQLEVIIGSENRIKNIANDIILHFGQSQGYVVNRV
jgi:type I restriction enzyme, R subunit